MNRRRTPPPDREWKEDRQRAGELVGAIGHSDGEDEQVLDRLEQLCRETGDPEIWDYYAYALDATGRLGKATELLEWLVDSVPDDPWYQLHLARVCNAGGKRELARRRLRAVMANDTRPDLVPLAHLELATLVITGPIDADDHRVMRRQRDALRARIRRGDVTPDTVVKLARLAVEQRRIDFDGRWLTEALGMLEEAHRRAPSDVAVLEQLVLVRFFCGNAKADAALIELERSAPDSPVVQVFTHIPLDESGPAAEPERLSALIHTVAEGAASERAQALQELEESVARHPRDPEQRTFYAIALQIADQSERAVEQARAAARLAGDDSGMHYNIGSVFLRAGKRSDAKRHLQLARRYAQTAEDRTDAEELLAQLP